MDDLISRQAAIDALMSTVFSINLIYGRSERGMKAAKEAVGLLKALPSAQPELIRCKDCKYNGECSIQYAAYADDKFFCGAGERRHDGKTT